MQPRSRGLANGFSPWGLKAATGKPPGRGLVECLAFDPRPEGLGYGKTGREFRKCLPAAPEGHSGSWLLMK